MVGRVCTAAGDRVPGPRSYALLSPVEFPWRTAVDQVEEVGSRESYSLSLDLTRNGLVCGPSSGLNLQGLYQLVGKRKAQGTLAELAGPDGEVHCVFLCCDLPYQYVNEYFDKLGEAYFAPVNNKVRRGAVSHVPGPGMADDATGAARRRHVPVRRKLGAHCHGRPRRLLWRRRVND